MRVSGVRRSWLTAASISVRWLMWRRMRWRIRLKACAAWRISSAPRGRKSPTSRPLPKLSAARASWRIGRICRRRKKIEIAESTIELPTIQASRSQVVVLVTRLRAAITCSRPGSIWTKTATRSGSSVSRSTANG